MAIAKREGDGPPHVAIRNIALPNDFQVPEALARRRIRRKRRGGESHEKRDGCNPSQFRLLCVLPAPIEKLACQKATIPAQNEEDRSCPEASAAAARTHLSRP